MARASSKSPPAESLEKVLPLHSLLLEHHRQSLDRTREQWALQHRVPPVLLLTGISGVGKREMVYHLAQCLLCERTSYTSKQSRTEPGVESQDSFFGDALFTNETSASTESSSEAMPQMEPCGECAQCQRALSNHWVDFTEISASREDGETGTLKIDQFRDLKASMGFGAFDGKFRITLIRDADRMTVQAANSLLKLLEEPPPDWVFFLTASDASNLLPTMVSRCQILKLRPFSKARLIRRLTELQVPSDRLAACAELAQGSWRKTEGLATEETWDRRSQILNFLETPPAEVSSLVDWASSEPANFALLLDQLEQCLAELIRWSVEPATPLTHRALKAHAEAQVQARDGALAARHFWTERAERVFRARHESLAPLNKKLLLQDILLPFCA